MNEDADRPRGRGVPDSRPVADPTDAWMTIVADAASRDSGGVPVDLLGDYLPLLAAAVSGCALMPASVPASWDVWAGQHDPKNLPYAFVRVTPKVASVLAKAVPRLVSEFQDRSRPRDRSCGAADASIG